MPSPSSSTEISSGRRALGSWIWRTLSSTRLYAHLKAFQQVAQQLHQVTAFAMEARFWIDLEFADDAPVGIDLFQAADDLLSHRLQQHQVAKVWWPEVAARVAGRRDLVHALHRSSSSLRGWLHPWSRQRTGRVTPAGCMTASGVFRLCARSLRCCDTAVLALGVDQVVDAVGRPRSSRGRSVSRCAGAFDVAGSASTRRSDRPQRNMISIRNSRVRPAAPSTSTRSAGRP